MNEQRFDGRVALVTGGSSGIGAAVAGRLLEEGAHVASLDLAEHAPDGVLGIAGDVSSSADVEAAVARVTSELGPVDILVCSAGIAGALAAHRRCRRRRVAARLRDQRRRGLLLQPRRRPAA